MTLSAECCCDKCGDRGGGGGALAHQRRLIRGLLMWAAFLTLGLAASMALHFIHRETAAPHHRTEVKKNLTQWTKEPPMFKNIELTTFTPAWDRRDENEVLQWNPMLTSFIEGKEKLKVKENGEYFLYLHITLVSKDKESYLITVQKDKDTVLLKGYINETTFSTGFMGTVFPMNSGDMFKVTCEPKAKIESSYPESYMGIIKLS